MSPSKKTLLSIALVLVAASALSAGILAYRHAHRSVLPTGNPNRFSIPVDVAEIFESANAIELVSIDVVETGPQNAEERELGSVTLYGKDAKALFTAFQKSVATNKKTNARCYEPRHVLRATSGLNTATIEICFTCNGAFADVNGGERLQFYPGRMAKNVFNKALTDAHIKIAD